MIWCFINKFVQLKKVLWVLMLWYRYVNIVHCFGFVSKWLVSIRFILKLIQSISNWLAMLSPKMCHLWLSGYGSCTTKIYKLDAYSVAGSILTSGSMCLTQLSSKSYEALWLYFFIKSVDQLQVTFKCLCMLTNNISVCLREFIWLHYLTGQRDFNFKSGSFTRAKDRLILRVDS